MAQLATVGVELSLTGRLVKDATQLSARAKEFTRLFVQESRISAVAATAGMDASTLNPLAKAVGGAAEKIGQICKPGFLDINSRTFHHAFSKHAKDFGIKRNWCKEAAKEFEEILKSHVGRITPIRGKFRADDALHYFDQKTKLSVATYMDGRIAGAWKLSEDQIKYLLSTGVVK